MISSHDQSPCNGTFWMARDVVISFLDFFDHIFCLCLLFCFSPALELTLFHASVFVMSLSAASEISLFHSINGLCWMAAQSEMNGSRQLCMRMWTCMHVFDLNCFRILNLFHIWPRPLMEINLYLTSDAGSQNRCRRVGRGSQPPSTPNALPNPTSNTDKNTNNKAK